MQKTQNCYQQTQVNTEFLGSSLGDQELEEEGSITPVRGDGAGREGQGEVRL